jgi:hypothetical protein
MSVAFSVDDILRRKYSTIESLIANPICRGYLLQFSESQFNSENLNFVSEVDRFRDIFFAVDKDLWSMHWMDIDKKVENDEREGKLVLSTWPSAVNLIAAKIFIDKILDEYILDHAHNQVCISKQFILKMKKRISLLHLYGPHVFEEACIDPIKTMKKDVLPRFLHSNISRTMILSLASCDPLPPASNLSLPPPSKYVLRSNPVEYFTDERKFSLVQLLQGEVLYTNFRVFLERIVCSENLICVRMIDYFEELKSAKNDKDADGQAWIIYQYFVAPGSAFEVSTLYLDRKNLMQQLASPRKGMFAKVRNSAYYVLKTNFELFTTSEDYKALGKIMRFAKLALDRFENNQLDPTEVGCFEPFLEIIRTRSNSSEYNGSVGFRSRTNSAEFDGGSPKIFRIKNLKSKETTKRPESVETSGCRGDPDFSSFVYDSALSAKIHK